MPRFDGATRRLRERFWLLVMDAIALRGGFGSPAYLWALERASNATDWGVCPPGNGDEPW